MGSAWDPSVRVLVAGGFVSRVPGPGRVTAPAPGCPQHFSGENVEVLSLPGTSQVFTWVRPSELSPNVRPGGDVRGLIPTPLPWQRCTDPG